jgi:hypothetical protein
MEEFMESNERKWHFSPMMIIGPILGFIGIVLIGLLFGFAVQYLWNWIMPAIFSLRPITYWEGFGIFILAKLLFGGHHGFKHHGRKFKKKFRTRYCCGDDDNENGFGKWKHYNKFWKEEGKAAFEKYIAQCACKKDEK